MASVPGTLGGRFWLAVTVSVLVVGMLFTVNVDPAVADQKEEIIIEGEDKRPPKSSFDYDKESTQKNGSQELRETGDVPSTEQPGSGDQPGMRKELEPRHEKLDSEKDSEVNEWGSWKTFLIILGIGALAAAFA